MKLVKGRKNFTAVNVDKAKDVRMPLVSIRPSGIGGEYQREGWDRLSRTYMVKIGLSLNRQMLQLTINCRFCLI